MNLIRSIGWWAFVSIFGLFSVGCLYLLINLARINHHTGSIKSSLETELQVGSRKETIETILTKNNLSFTFNPYLSRYEILSRVSKYSGVLVKIYVDDAGNLVRTEVNSFTTGP